MMLWQQHNTLHNFLCDQCLLSYHEHVLVKLFQHQLTAVELVRSLNGLRLDLMSCDQLLVCVEHWSADMLINEAAKLYIMCVHIQGNSLIMSSPIHCLEK